MDERACIHSLVVRHYGPRPYGRPVKAAPAHITRDMRPEEAFRATLSDCLAQLTANAATLRAGRSVEGLHQLRVAFRRLEVALGAFAKEFRQDWLEELRGRARVLSGRMVAARDLDVFVGTLLAGALERDAAPAGAIEGAQALRVQAEAAREAAWATARDCVAGADFARFLDDVAALAQSRLPMGQGRKLPRTAARILARQARRVERRGRAARGGGEADLHRLRIALKKLRYSSEFFAPLYPARRVKAYLARVRRLQEELGHLNDIATVRITIAGLLRGSPAQGKSGEGQSEGGQSEGGKSGDGLRLAAGIVLGWYGAQTPRAVKKVLKRYRKFRALTPFWA
jgi:CHAD domain-containing protein